MVNAKSTTLSQEQKEEIKEIVKEKKGTQFLGAIDVSALEIDVPIRKTKVPYDEIKTTLEANQAYQFKGSRNAINNIMAKIEQKYSIKTVFVKLKGGNFAIYKQKEKA